MLLASQLATIADDAADADQACRNAEEIVLPDDASLLTRAEALNICIAAFADRAVDPVAACEGAVLSLQPDDPALSAKVCMQALGAARGD